MQSQKTFPIPLMSMGQSMHIKESKNFKIIGTQAKLFILNFYSCALELNEALYHNNLAAYIAALDKLEALDLEVFKSMSLSPEAAPVWYKGDKLYAGVVDNEILDKKEEFAHYKILSDLLGLWNNYVINPTVDKCCMAHEWLEAIAPYALYKDTLFTGFRHIYFSYTTDTKNALEKARSLYENCGFMYDSHIWLLAAACHKDTEYFDQFLNIYLKHKSEKSTVQLRHLVRNVSLLGIREEYNLSSWKKIFYHAFKISAFQLGEAEFITQKAAEFIPQARSFIYDTYCEVNSLEASALIPIHVLSIDFMNKNKKSPSLGIRLRNVLIREKEFQVNLNAMLTGQWPSGQDYSTGACIKDMTDYLQALGVSVEHYETAQRAAVLESALLPREERQPSSAQEKVIIPSKITKI